MAEKLADERLAVFLVVDDDELSRELLTVLLEAEGYGVRTAVSGPAALDAITRRDQNLDDRAAFAPNVILADLQMPGLSGDTLAIALRAASPPGTRLLAMSGSTPPVPVAAFDGFLLKPFTMDELRAAVSSAGVGPQSAAPSNDVALPAFNEAVYGKLAEAMPADQLRQIFSLFVSDARSRAENMRMLAETGDDAGYRAAAHAIKGGAGMLGASEIYRLAEIAEDRGLDRLSSESHGQSPNGTPANTQVMRSFERFFAAIARLEGILLERLR